MNTDQENNSGYIRRHARNEEAGRVLPSRKQLRREISYQGRELRRKIPKITRTLSANETERKADEVFTNFQRSQQVRPDGATHNLNDQALDNQQYWPLPVYEIPKRPQLVIKKISWRKIMIRSTAVLASVALIVTGVFAWRAYSTANRVLTGSSTVAALSPEETKPILMNTEGDGRVNILLLGVGGAGHDGGELTDTIVLASVDPVNNKTILLSVPRDLWVKTNATSSGMSKKINAVYVGGRNEYAKKNHTKTTDKAAINAGLSALDGVVSQVLGVRIDYHVKVDFRAFEQAVDTIGGITVDVKKPLIDASMAWENDDNPVLARGGLQAMSGDKALLYARSRHTSSDFDRSERQRQLLVAIKNKAITINTMTNPLKLEGLLKTFGNNFYTDMSADAAMKLVNISKNMVDTNIASVDLVSPSHQLVTTDRVGSQSVVRPKAGFDTYSDIQNYVRGQLVDGYILKESAPITVIAHETTKANETITRLSSVGYIVNKQAIIASVENSPILVDLSKGKSPYTKHYLEKRFDTSALETLPAGVTVPEGTQFAILVGR